VFSEVYYPKGWNAYIDGNPAPYVKVNYVLRGMSVPAGKHSIEFRFEPLSYKRGVQISYTASILLWVTMAGALIAFGLQQRKKNKI
jgi:uncharacterized membrane protein YfhO